MGGEIACVVFSYDMITFDRFVAATPFEPTTPPAGGEIVEALPKVTFFAPENSEWWNPNSDCSEGAVITRNGETIATYPASIVADEYYNYGEDSYYLPVPQDNKAGTYTLTVPEKFFKSNLGYSAAKTITWTVLGSYTQGGLPQFRRRRGW